MTKATISKSVRMEPNNEATWNNAKAEALKSGTSIGPLVVALLQGYLKGKIKLKFDSEGRPVVK